MANFMQQLGKFNCSMLTDPTQDALSLKFLVSFGSELKALGDSLPTDPDEFTNFASYKAGLSSFIDGFIGDNSFDWENPSNTEKCIVIESLHKMKFKDHSKALEDEYRDKLKDTINDLKDEQKAAEKALDEEYDERKDNVNDKDERIALKEELKEREEELENQYDDKIDLLKDERKCKHDEFKNLFEPKEKVLDSIGDMYDKAFDNSGEGVRFFVRHIEEFSAFEMSKDETKIRETLQEKCEDLGLTPLEPSTELVVSESSVVHSEL